MADPTNGSPKSAGSGKRDLSQETRLIIAFVLMGAVLFLTPLFYKQQKPAESSKGQPASKSQRVEQAAKAQPQNEAKQPKAEPPAAGAAAGKKPGTTTPAPAAEVKKTDREQILTFENQFYKVAFSNRGAVVRSWQLKQ